MESTNPFIQRISVASKHLENYEPITDEDAKRYPLRGQNYKFTHPDKFAFIDMPVEFIAMEVNEEQQVQSMLLYLDRHETMLDILTIAYGTPAIGLNIEGESEYDTENLQLQHYTSHTWILDGHRLTLTIVPVNASQTNTALKAQLYMRS